MELIYQNNLNEIKVTVKDQGGVVTGATVTASLKNYEDEEVLALSFMEQDGVYNSKIDADADLNEATYNLEITVVKDGKKNFVIKPVQVKDREI